MLGREECFAHYSGLDLGISDTHSPYNLVQVEGVCVKPRLKLFMLDLKNFHSGHYLQFTKTDIFRNSARVFVNVNENAVIYIYENRSAIPI